MGRGSIQRAKAIIWSFLNESISYELDKLGKLVDKTFYERVKKTSTKNKRNPATSLEVEEGIRSDLLSSKEVAEYDSLSNDYNYQDEMIFEFPENFLFDDLES